MVMLQVGLCTCGSVPCHHFVTVDKSGLLMEIITMNLIIHQSWLSLSVWGGDKQNSFYSY